MNRLCEDQEYVRIAVRCGSVSRPIENRMATRPVLLHQLVGAKINMSMPRLLSELLKLVFV